MLAHRLQGTILGAVSAVSLEMALGSGGTLTAASGAKIGYRCRPVEPACVP